MAQRRVLSRAARHGLVAMLLLAGVACKSVPVSVVVTPSPAPVLARDTKMGWIARLEQQRMLRDPGVAPVAPAGDPDDERVLAPASAAALDALALDVDPVVRRRALIAIGRIGEAAGIPVLVAALKDSDEDSRAAAAFALGLMGPDAKGARSSVEAALADASWVVRARAIEGLGLIGDAAAVPAIFQAAGGCPARIATIEPDDETPKSPEVEVCRAAMYAFVRLKNYDGVAALTLTPQGQPVSRWWPVAFALQRIGDKRAAPALLVLASTPGVNTAGFALRGLAALKDPAATVIARTLSMSRTADVKVRIAAVRALGQIGGASGAAPLLELLATPALPPNLALETIGALGVSAHRPAFDTILDFVTDSAPHVRVAALTAAARVAPEPFLVALSSIGRDPDWSVRAALAGILATLPTDRVLAGLGDLAADNDARVHGPALEALASVKAPDLTRRLFAALEAPDLVERSTAARLIGETRPDGGIARLMAAYERGQSDQSYDARAAALVALARYGGDDVRITLRRGLGDREWPVRWRTAQLLRELGDATAAPERPAPLHVPLEYFESAAFLRPAFSPHAFVETSHGVIELELDVVETPLASKNFIDLARREFFNGMAIHRVVPTFVIQAGDPRGDSQGGPGYSIPDELTPQPFVRGTLGMALDWRDTGGSQWFITLSPQPHLDAKYTAFGRVVNGWDVLDRLAPWDVIDRVRIWDGTEFK